MITRWEKTKAEWDAREAAFQGLADALDLCLMVFGKHEVVEGYEATHNTDACAICVARAALDAARPFLTGT